MARIDDCLNLLLGACAVGYSFLPPHRVPRYRRGVALTLRIGGALLLLVSLAGLWLDHHDAQIGRSLMPAHGRGLVAGSSVRPVLELAGITNVIAKVHSGSKNGLNNARAAIEALKSLKV